MNVPVQSRQALIEAFLPRDPDDGDIFIVPENTTVGGSTVIFLQKAGNPIGVAQTLTPMINVSRKYTLSRTITDKVLKINDVIGIKATLLSYNKLVFIEGFNWVADEASTVETLLDEGNFKILFVSKSLLHSPSTGIRIYENICLERIKANVKNR